MAILTRDRLQPLLKVGSRPCISLYMPTHRHHPGTEQDPIRFRNALKEAERLLSDRHSPQEIRSLLDPVEALPNVEFWRHQADGLAILRSPDVLEQFRVPLSMPELVVVAESFHVRPLIRCLNSNERYFLIAITQNGVGVYEGAMTSLTPTEVPGLPGGLSEFSSKKRRGTALSAHATGRGSGSRQVHAAGGAGAPPEEVLLPFFRAIDRALQRALRHDTAPVILAGVEYYLPIYRQVSHLKRLADVIVTGSPDAMTLDELRSRAWPVAETVLRGNEDRALEKYWRAAERGRTREPLEDIVREARRGRVRRLFLASGVRIWGTVDPNTGHIHRTSAQQGSHDDDVLDDVAEAVFLYGGDVITLPAERMPNAQEVAAELR